MPRTSKNKPANKKAKSGELGRQKKVSNPISTGGRGVTFERRVQAMRLLAMCLGLPCAGVRDNFVIASLLFQGRAAGHNTDDLVVFTVRPGTNQKSRLNLQMKRSLRASDNKTFIDSVGLAWLDFKRSEFTRGLDENIIIYDVSSATSMKGALEVVNFARGSTSAEGWHNRVHLEGFSNASNRTAYAAIKAAAEQYNDLSIEADDLYQFVLHLRFMPHDLDTDTSAEVAGQKQLIKQAMPWSQPGGVWSQFVSACSELNGYGGEVNNATVSRYLGDLTQELALFKLWQSSLASPQTSPLVVDVPAVQRLLPLMATLEPLFPDSAAVIASAEIPQDLLSAAMSPASSIFSRHLDRVKQLHNDRCYREALAQLETLQDDLEAFDTHQKARWYFLRGMCKWHLAEDDSAASDLETAAKIHTEDDRIAAGSVRALLLRKEVARALEVGQELMQRFPESFAVWQIVTNARVMNRQVLTEDDIPLAFADMAGAWQMLASSLASAEDDEGAIRAIEIALEKPDASIFILENFLRLVVRSATQNTFHVNNRWQPEDRRQLLLAAISRFDDREKVLWSEQSVRVKTDIVFHLAYAFLLLSEPAQALAIIEQGRQRGVPGHAGTSRIEIEALRDLERNEEVVKRFEAHINQLDTDALVPFGQACLNEGRDDLLQHAMAEVARRIAAAESPADDMLFLASKIFHQLHWELLLRERQHERVRSELNELGVSPASTNIAYLVFAARAYVDDELIRQRYVDRVAELALTSTVAHELALASQLMFTVQRFDEVILILERVLPNDTYTPLHDDLIQCYAMLDQRAKLRDLLKALPADWRNSKDARQAALHVYGNAGDWPRMLELAEEAVVKHPEDAAAWLLLIQISASADVETMRACLSRLPMSLSGTTESLLRLGSIELTHGDFDQGMERIYRAMRCSAGELEATALHMMIMITVAQASKRAQEKPHAVGPGTSVELEDSAGASGHISIDLESTTPLPETEEFVLPISAKAAALMGLQVGEQVSFPTLVGQQTFVVKRLISVHQRLIELSNHRILNTVAPSKMLTAMSIPRLENGDYDLSIFIEQLEMRKAKGLHTLNLYQQHVASIGLVARLIGVDVIDLVKEWPAEGGTLEVSFERGVLDNPFAGAATTLSWAVDLTMLVELATLGLLDVLEHLPAVYVSSATKLALATKIDKSSRLRPVGMMYAYEGKLGIEQQTEEGWMRDQAFLNAIESAIDSYCRVVPSYGPRSAAHLVKLQDVLSDEDYATLLVCQEYGCGLLSLDGRLRLMANTLDIRTASPQMLLSHAASHGHLSWVEYSCAIVKMIIGQRNFIGIDTFDLIAMMDQGPVFANLGLNSLRAYLATPLLAFTSAVPVITDFIRKMYMSGRCDVGVMLQLIEYCLEPMFRHPECPESWDAIVMHRMIRGLRGAHFNQRTQHAIGIRIELAKEHASRPGRQIELEACVTYGPCAPFYGTLIPSSLSSELMQGLESMCVPGDGGAETQANPQSDS